MTWNAITFATHGRRWGVHRCDDAETWESGARGHPDIWTSAEEVIAIRHTESLSASELVIHSV
jgi:hypothetical protein